MARVNVRSGDFPKGEHEIVCPIPGGGTDATLFSQGIPCIPHSDVMKIVIHREGPELGPQGMALLALALLGGFIGGIIGLIYGIIHPSGIFGINVEIFVTSPLGGVIGFVAGGVIGAAVIPFTIGKKIYVTFSAEFRDGKTWLAIADSENFERIRRAVEATKPV